MNEHTPGPWVSNFSQEDGSFGSLRIESEREHGDVNDGWAIASVTGSDAQANARLIAAAPELLAALSIIVDHVEAGDGTKWSSQVALAKTALAKAKRGTP